MARRAKKGQEKNEAPCVTGATIIGPITVSPTGVVRSEINRQTLVSHCALHQTTTETPDYDSKWTHHDG